MCEGGLAGVSGAVSGDGYLPSQLASWLHFPSGDWPGLSCHGMLYCGVSVRGAVNVEVGRGVGGGTGGGKEWTAW